MKLYFMRILLIFISVVLFTHACNNSNEPAAAQTTEIIEVWEDGLPKVVRLNALDDGQKIAVREIHYYPDGEKYLEGPLSNNKRHGLWKSYYKNGSLWSEGTFQNGVRHGKGVVYHANGNKYAEGDYLNGKRSGEWKWWNENGKSIDEQEALQFAPEMDYQ